MMQVLPPCGHAVQEDKPEKVRMQLNKFNLGIFVYQKGKQKQVNNSDISGLIV